MKFIEKEDPAPSSVKAWKQMFYVEFFMVENTQDAIMSKVWKYLAFCFIPDDCGKKDKIPMGPLCITRESRTGCSQVLKV